ncbi:alpha-amylase 1-like [Glandiceps talaboti]
MKLLAFCVLLLATTAWGQWNENMKNNRAALVHLFEWKWSDVAKECENVLGPWEYGGVQVSPPNEHREVPGRPWWERYQPVGYQLVSRSGDRNAFIDMVNRCNDKGVNIYTDIVINHMCGTGVSGYGTAGNWYDTTFDRREFPAVPYSEWDFNDDICNRNIENYGDPWEVRNCRLVGLVDLKMSKSYVRDKLVDFMNDMIDLGVAGFRVDACKHMWPEDLEVIYNGLNDLPTSTFPAGSRAYLFQEVIDQGGEPIKATDYTHLGRVTEFKYGLELSNCFRGNNNLRWLSNWGEAWGFLSRFDALAFIDNHDNQRGHGGGSSPLTYKEPRAYKMATEFMLAHDYGSIRIMSSYYFEDTEIGPPADGNGNTNDVECSVQGGWVCEHRWRQIYHMVWFRQVVHGTSVQNWWDNGSNQIAFSRGNKGWIAFNLDSWNLNTSINTGLPAGTYCNLIVADYDSNTRSCTDRENNGTPRTVTVAGNGFASVNIPVNSDPVVAIHVEATL